MDTNAQTNDKQAQSPVRGGVVAYLQLDGAMKAAEYYKKALGAEIETFHPVDDQGRTMHIHLYINGSSVMLCDPYPDYGHPLEKPQAFNHDAAGQRYRFLVETRRRRRNDDRDGAAGDVLGRPLRPGA